MFFGWEEGSSGTDFGDLVGILTALQGPVEGIRVTDKSKTRKPHVRQSEGSVRQKKVVSDIGSTRPSRAGDIA